MLLLNSHILILSEIIRDCAFLINDEMQIKKQIKGRCDQNKAKNIIFKTCDIPLLGKLSESSEKHLMNVFHETVTISFCFPSNLHTSNYS